MPKLQIYLQSGVFSCFSPKPICFFLLKLASFTIFYVKKALERQFLSLKTGRFKHLKPQKLKSHLSHPPSKLGQF
jgi:hypothetical protein